MIVNKSKVKSFKSASDFWSVSEDYLSKEPDLNATLIAVTNLIIERDPVFTGPFWFGVIVAASGEIKGCAIHAQPDGLLVYGVELKDSEILFDAIDTSIGSPSRITARSEICIDLTKRWTRNSEKKIKLTNDWKVLRVDSHSLVVPSCEGKLRKGTPCESEIVRDWGNQYAEEKPAFLNISEYLVRKLDRSELFVWDHEGPKTLVTVSRGSLESSRISGVFTPESYRGRGYAAAAVSSVCRQLVSSSPNTEFVTLLAQLGDPAERLYEKLGFKEIGRQYSVTFETS